MELTILDSSAVSLYEGVHDTRGNSGFDLYLPEWTVFPAGKVTFVNFQVAARTVDGAGFWLLPRSSLSKTSLRLANSVGLIDPGYRGPLIAALENVSDEDVAFPRGTRLVQIARSSLLPFRVDFVASMDVTARGSGGFGSTGAGLNGVNYVR
jgi:dUTP pyrophosphatase